MKWSDRQLTDLLPEIVNKFINGISDFEKLPDSYFYEEHQSNSCISPTNSGFLLAHQR
jgi:hypothetical protein